MNSIALMVLVGVACGSFLIVISSAFGGRPGFVLSVIGGAVILNALWTLFDELREEREDKA